MNLVKAGFEFIEQGPGLEGAFNKLKSQDALVISQKIK